jgi:hypothetical protein
MDEHYQPRLFALLKENYADPRNTLTWALLIGSLTAVALTLFMSAEATILRSIAVAAGWSAIHLLRRS